MTMETPPTIALPLSAWAQAGIVCLFIVFVIVLLWMLLRFMFQHFNDIMTSLDTVVNRFQNSMEMRDNQFLNALSNRDDSFDERNAAVIVAITEISKGQVVLSSSFEAHNARMVQALEDMRKARAKRTVIPKGE